MSVLPFHPDQICQLDNPELSSLEITEHNEYLTQIIGIHRTIEAVRLGNGFRTQP